MDGELSEQLENHNLFGKQQLSFHSRFPDLRFWLASGRISSLKGGQKGLSIKVVESPSLKVFKR